MSPDVGPMERLAFESAQIMAENPPVWRHPNKQAVFDVACPPGSNHSGTIEYSRWGPMALPESLPPGSLIELVVNRPGFFDYAPLAEFPDASDWHVNFADPHLFVAYSSSLFAQDEMQVAEHPALGALKETLNAKGMADVIGF
jgi:hypothetical protein